MSSDGTVDESEPKYDNDNDALVVADEETIFTPVSHANSDGMAKLNTRAIAQPGDAEKSLREKGAKEVLKIDSRYATIKVLPNDSVEGKGANFPRNLHNAGELFLRLGMKDNAVRLQEATEKVFTIYSAGPDGRSTQAMGRACVCWNCGHVGLPSNADKCTKGPVPAGICKMCETNDQTNFVKVSQANGNGELPWMEVKAVAPESAPGSSDRAPEGAEKVSPGQRLVSKKIKPNSECPCGSGKKAKKCCHIGGT